MPLFLVYRPEFGEHWPLDSDKTSVIIKNRSELLELLDADDDLISAMLSRDVFSKHKLRSIQNATDLQTRNWKFLDILTESSLRNFNRFVECLQSTQCHLVPLFTGDTGKRLLNFHKLEIFI